MKKHPLFSLLASVLFGLTALSQHTMAQTAAVTSWTEGSVFSGFYNNETVGWRFQAINDMTVYSLGIWDQNSDGLAAIHQVGLWTDAGTLLAQVAVQVNSTLINGFRYANLQSTVSLSAGQNYVLGAQDLVFDGDNYSTSVSNLITSSDIQYLAAARTNNDAGFAFPNVYTQNSGGRFGPNMLYRTSNSVPDAGSSLVFVGIGFVLLGAVRRKLGA